MLLKKHKEGLDVMPGGEINLSCRFSPEIGLWKSRITVTVNAARGLIAKDAGGTSDPYVCIFLGKQKPKNWYVQILVFFSLYISIQLMLVFNFCKWLIIFSQKTPTVKKTLTPQWKEGNNFSFEFPLGYNFDTSEELFTILLFDEDTCILFFFSSRLFPFSSELGLGFIYYHSCRWRYWLRSSPRARSLLWLEEWVVQNLLYPWNYSGHVWYQITTYFLFFFYFLNQI